MAILAIVRRDLRRQGQIMTINRTRLDLKKEPVRSTPWDLSAEGC